MKHPSLSAMFLWGALVAGSGESPGQSGWQWQNPTPQGNDLAGIVTFSRDTLLLIGNHSTFLLSTDAGATWQSNTADGAQFDQVRSATFGDPQSGFVTADSSVYRTTDGGTSWSPVFTGPIIASCFLGSQRGCVLLSSAGPDGSRIYHTNDGGSSWNSQTLSISLQRACMAFSDSLHGIILGYQGEILTTSNGGTSWTYNGYGAYWGNTAIYFLNSQSGWFVGEAANICKTTNGGQSWNKQYTGNDWETLLGVYFKDATRGWAWGPGLFLTTTNGGISWSKASKPVSGDITTIQFADSNTGWTVGSGGMILRSANGGASWVARSTQLDASRFNAVQFVSENEGWVTGSATDGTTGVVYHSTDGGTTWTLQMGTLPEEGTSLWFVNRDTGWISTGDLNTGGRILKTTDNGNTWSQKARVTTPLRNVVFTSQWIGWAVGQGTMFKTTDGGDNWTQLPTGLENPNLQWCDFSDSLLGWVVGVTSENGAETALVAVTTDGGATWARRTLPSLQSLRKVEFLNERLGWAVGDSETIFATTDGGQSWEQQHRSGAPPAASLSAVFFADSLHGWAAGGSGAGHGIILQTSDGGKTWWREPIDDKALLGLCFINAKTGWAVGGGGTILKTTTGGTILAVETPNASAPVGYCLFQNYPNPFNPLTIIKYTVGGNRGWGLGVSDVSLVVYDLLGRTVAVLVNEQKPPGQYEVTFDGSKLASGVYFYRLHAGDPSLRSERSFVETKKLLLLK
jgi:photosystem II stability/assembly factor-like uncharacterized protein